MSPHIYKFTVSAALAALLLFTQQSCLAVCLAAMALHDATARTP